MIAFKFSLHNYHLVSWQPIESKRNENVNRRQLSGVQVMSSVFLAHVSILLLRVSWLNMHQRPVENNSSAQHTNFHKFFFLTRMKIAFYPFEAFLNDGTTGKKGHTWFPLFSWPVPFRASPCGFYGERVGVGVQREFTGSVPFIRWSDKMNHETEIWGVLVQLARLQKIVKCRDKHWQLPLWCHVAASFTAEAPWVSQRYSCFLPSRVNKYVGDPLTFHP